MILTSSSIDSKPLSNDLLSAAAIVFAKVDLKIAALQKEQESREYNAYHFQLNHKNICYRQAKITPTKTGQFVTLWKRNLTGVIAPFDYSDEIDFVMINVRREQNWGLFIFPKQILLEKGVFSTADKEGIRATRVYPAWDATTSKQAQKTQKWQLNYFFEFTDQENIDWQRLSKTI